MHSYLRILTGAALAVAQVGTAYAQRVEEPDSVRYRLPEVRVEVTRLGVGGLPLARVPFVAHVVSGAAVERARYTLADPLTRLPGVSTMDALGTPFQPSLFLRGFSLSPVVGLPQGVSVFVDGVRVNEPDASQVNFDLLPMSDVERVEVLRGPTGAFGKNTLAGAIHVVTRRGSRQPAAGAELRGGSFGRVQGQAFASGASGPFDYYVSGSYLRGDGWRDQAHARLGQLFAKGGWRGEATDAWVSYTFGRNRILQAGALPASWLDSRDSVPDRFRGGPDPRTINFTGGDLFEPTLHFLSTRLTRRLAPSLALHATGFVRATDMNQFNANFTEPDTRLDTRNRSVGGTLQLARRAAGVELSGGVEYTLNDVGIRIFAHPNENHPDLPASGALSEDVGTWEHNWAAFTQLRLHATPRLALTGSLRFDYVDLPFRDQLDPDNDGDNLFRQLTGSAGVDYQAGPGVIAFASYGRGFRAPVLMELACADPEDPCPLPFELGADPPLDPVTTDTWQAGVRFFRGSALELELAAYRAEVHDEIFNVQPAGTVVGYFQNLERTRRQGVELAATVRPAPALQFSGNLTYTRATFQITATLSAPFLEGEEEEEGEPDLELEPPTVRPGSELPLIPRVRANLGADYTAGPWRAGLDWTHVGSQWMRGDEDNDDDQLEAYSLVGAHLARVVGRLELFASVDNLLDTHHAAFGVLTLNRLNDPDHPRLEPFLTPGLPRRVHAGVRYRW